MKLDTELIKYWKNLIESEQNNTLTKPSAVKDDNMDEAMSIDDILNAHKDKEEEQKKKEAEEKARKEKEDFDKRIESITITDIKDDNSIKYVIKYADGRTKDDTFPGIDMDDEYAKKMRYTLRKMSGKTPDEYDIAIAMMRAAFDRASKTPIKWFYEFDKSNGELDDDWYYKPNEDYFGWSKSDIDAMVDSGWSHPLITR